MPRGVPPRPATRSSSTSSPTTAAASSDYVVELGSGRLIPELEEQLVGMSAGETKEIELERAGEEEPMKVEAVVKEIKEKVLPELDDELARSASEFDTLDELRADIEQRIREQIEAEVNEAFRRAALDKARRGVERPGFRARSSTPARGRCCVSSTPSCSAAAARSTPTSRCPATRPRS